MKKNLLFWFFPAIVVQAFAQVGPPVNFQPGAVINLPAGARPSALAVTDFNQDFQPDIAVCQQGLGSVGVYLQSPVAVGTFSATPVATYPVGDGPTGLVAVALGLSQAQASNDLVAISPVTGYYTLLTNKNDGSGTFTPVVSASSYDNYFAKGAASPSTNPQLVTADLNGNGLAEFIYSYDCTIPLIYMNVYRYELYNNIRVNPSEMARFHPGYQPTYFALDDFDRDGRTDIVTTNPVNNEFSTCFGSFNGSDQYWSGVGTIWPSSGSRPMQVTTGDVNYDFLPDIAVAQEGSANIMLFLNLKNRRFGSQVPYALSAAPRQVLLADLNRDSSPEMLVLTADNKLQIFQHTGATDASRYTTPIQLATGNNPVTMKVVDVNGDFRPDIVVGCAGDNTVRVYLNQSLVLATRPKPLANVEVYPNPATHQVTVHCPATAAGPVTATLQDVLGRVMQRTALTTASNALEVGALPRGVYVLQLVSAEGMYSQRVLLQ